MSKSQHANAEAYIEGGAIIIKVDISALGDIVEGAWAAGGTENRLKVTDPENFACELVSALNEEDEQGTTPVHQMFDRAILAAYHQGAEGIDKHEDQEDGDDE